MQRKTFVPMGLVSVKLRIYRATEPPTKQKRNALTPCLTKPPFNHLSTAVLSESDGLHRGHILAVALECSLQCLMGYG